MAEVGDRVRTKYGEGTVVELDGELVIVELDDGCRMGLSGGPRSRDLEESDE